MSSASEKTRARRAVAFMVRIGELEVPERCQRRQCGRRDKLVAHHWHGYDEEHSLDVQWLCRACHNTVHTVRARSSSGAERVVSAMTRGRRKMTPEARRLAALKAWETKRKGSG